MNLLWRIANYARPVDKILPLYLFLILGATVFSVINLSALIPLLQVLFDQVQEPAQQEGIIASIKNQFYQKLHTYIRVEGKVAALYFICVLVAVSVLMANVFRYASQLILAKVRVRTIKNLRQEAFEQVLRFDIGYFNEQHKGDFVSRLTVDVQDVEQSIVSAMKALIKEPFLLIGYLVALFVISAELTLYTLVLIPAAGFGVSIVARKIRKWSRRSQESVGKLGGLLEEAFTGIRAIKAMNAQDWVKGRFEINLKAYARETYQIASKTNLSSPISEVVGVIVLVITLILGGKMVLIDQSMDAATFIGFLVIFSQLLNPAKAISVASSQINKGLASASRIFELLDQQQETAVGQLTPVFQQQIQFKECSFSYGDHLVLDQMSFQINRGEVIALVGPSGSGKSTIADLLCGFYHPKSGTILLDGVPLIELDQHLWRSHIAFVSQESVMFDDSIRNNILFGMEGISEEKLQEVIDQSFVSEFVNQMPAGLETAVGSNGSRLSGGQKQRIAIARAMLRNPELLILDEATSALDAQSEHMVQKALAQLMKDRTTLIIAHRHRSIQHADRILVINHGQIEESGNHEELVRKNGLYAELTQLQAF